MFKEKEVDRWLIACHLCSEKMKKENHSFGSSQVYSSISNIISGGKQDVLDNVCDFYTNRVLVNC